MKSRRHDTKVVDLARFRDARERRRRPLLELSEARPEPMPSRRSLSDREVDHRERMLRHLSRQ
jgi:hypothetical protein